MIPGDPTHVLELPELNLQGRNVTTTRGERGAHADGWHPIREPKRKLERQDLQGRDREQSGGGQSPREIANPFSWHVLLCPAGHLSLHGVPILGGCMKHGRYGCAKPHAGRLVSQPPLRVWPPPEPWGRARISNRTASTLARPPAPSPLEAAGHFTQASLAGEGPGSYHAHQSSRSQ